MDDRYLTELADWLRDAGLTVVEQDGWKSRARSSGGFDGNRPWCVMWHHTASNSAPENDAHFMSHGSSSSPIANIMPCRDGVVWTLAAGATNTNGKGSGVRDTSRGTVPVDAMNTYAVGMEIANNGVGGAYSVAQIDAAFAASLAITSHLGLEPDDVIQHFDYAPDRKVDPATAAAVQGPWRPRSVTSSGTWSLGDLRTECRRRAEAGSAITPPTKGDDDMPRFISRTHEGQWMIGDQVKRRSLDNADLAEKVIADAARTGVKLYDLGSGKPVSSTKDVTTEGGIPKRLGEPG